MSKLTGLADVFAPHELAELERKGCVVLDEDVAVHGEAKRLSQAQGISYEDALGRVTSEPDPGDPIAFTLAQYKVPTASGRRGQLRPEDEAIWTDRFGTTHRVDPQGLAELRICEAVAAEHGITFDEAVAKTMWALEDARNRGLDQVKI